MANEIVIDMNKKNNFTKNGVKIKNINHDELVITYLKETCTIQFSEDDIVINSFLISAVDARSYKANQTIIFDIAAFKESLDAENKKKHDAINLQNAVIAKEILLSAYVSGELKNVGLDVSVEHINCWFDIGVYSFIFPYSDEDFFNLNFDDLEISLDPGKRKIKFSEFLKTGAADIKKMNDAYELIQTLENKICKQFGFERDEFEYEDDE